MKTWITLLRSQSQEKSGLLTDGAPETVKQERWSSWGYDGTYGCFIDSIYDFFIDTICGFFINNFLPLLLLFSMMKVLGKVVTRAGRGYNNLDKNF